MQLALMGFYAEQLARRNPQLKKNYTVVEITCDKGDLVRVGAAERVEGLSALLYIVERRK